MLFEGFCHTVQIPNLEFRGGLFVCLGVFSLQNIAMEVRIRAYAMPDFI